MKNNRLPDSNEWEKIIEDAFSSSENHDFSVRYELQKAAIQKGITMKNSSNFIHRRYTAMVAAAAAIVVAIPVSVYAFTNGRPFPNNSQTNTAISDTANGAENKFLIEKENKYLYSLKYTPSKEADADTQNYKVEYTWLPDYLKSKDNIKVFYTANNDKLIYSYYRVSRDEPFDLQLDSITSYDIIEEDDKDIYFFRREEPAPYPLMSFRYEIWVHFKDTNFIANISLSDGRTPGIPDDDISKIINGMKLIPSDSEETCTWENYTNDYDDSNYESTEDTSEPTFNTDDLNIAHVGDDINYDIIGDTGTANMTLTIDKAWIQDNFDGINNDDYGTPTDFSQYLSDDGKIYDTIKWVKFGNGIDTINEIVKTEKIQMKVVVLEVTYKNNSDIDLADLKEGNFNQYVSSSYQYYFPNNIVSFDEDIPDPNPYSTIELNIYWAFSIEADNIPRQKHHIDVPAHQSTHAKLAMLVRADQLDDTYFDMTEYGMSTTRERQINDYYFPVKSIK